MLHQLAFEQVVGELQKIGEETDHRELPGCQTHRARPEPRAVDDEMHAFACLETSSKLEVEVLAAPGKRRVIRGGEVYAHHPEE